MKKILYLLIILVVAYALLFVYFYERAPESELPLVAIANYGPHASLEADIQGLKAELARQGFIENKTVRYHLVQVNFDLSLIPQMISQLVSEKPKVMVVISTPVAQFAKGAVQGIPLVYSVVTDPVEAKLLSSPEQSTSQLTGSPDKQDLHVFLQFVKQLLPQAHRIGILFATAEANDHALVRMMRQAAAESDMQVLAIPVNQARDVPLAMQRFKDQVDFIYVGASGTVQPTLPVIAAEAKAMHIPVFNMDESAVKDGMVLASIGVNYEGVGRSTGQLVADILRGESPAVLRPTYPDVKAYQVIINQSQAKSLGVTIPMTIPSLQIIE